MRRVCSFPKNEVVILVLFILIVESTIYFTFLLKKGYSVVGFQIQKTYLNFDPFI